jgi:hypothetical protein
MVGTPAAQGIVKTVAIAKQAGLGVPATIASPGQLLRRVTSVFTADRANYKSTEITPAQQSTGIGYGMLKTAGKLTALLSSGTYKLLMASALRADFAAGVNTGAIVTITAASTSGVQGTFTRSAGSFLTDGFKIGDVVRNTGWATTGAPNNNVNMLIIALTALIMTVTRFDTVAVGPKAAGDAVTITVAGKKTKAPLTGQTNDYFSVEDWYDIGRSELFTDCKVGQVDIGLPSTGNATFGASFMGLGRTRANAQVMSAAAVQTTTNIMAAVNGAIWINGVARGNITGLTLAINDNVIAGDAIVGQSNANDLGRGIIEVSGSFTALFTDSTIQDIYDAEQTVSLGAVLLDNPAVGLSDFIGLFMGAIKITTDAPDDGVKTIVRSYAFTAQINTAGGAALAYDNTILSIQDSAA